MTEVSRRGAIALLGAVAGLGIVGAPAPARALDPAAAQTFVEALADEMMSLVSSSMTLAEKKAQFQRVIEQKSAIGDIARVSLGLPWRELDEAGRAEYVSVFTEYLATTYVRRFEEYDGEGLEVLSATDGGRKGVFVKTRVIGRPAGGQPIDVDWRITDRNGPLQLLDLIVEGVSLVFTEQNNFKQLLDRNGGDVQELLEHLRRQSVLA